MKIISSHRGYQIVQNEDGSFSVPSLGAYLKFAAAWSCVVLIDEHLQP